MQIQIAVDVATARPPRTHATLHTVLDVDVPADDGTADGADRAFTHAVSDAHQTAALMAMCHPHVVMVVGIRTTDILSI